MAKEISEKGKEALKFIYREKTSDPLPTVEEALAKREEAIKSEE